VLSDALSLHPLCEGSLGDWSAWGVGVAGEMRREKKGKIFFETLAGTKRMFTFAARFSGAGFSGKDLEDYRAARLGWLQIEVL